MKQNAFLTARHEADAAAEIAAAAEHLAALIHEHGWGGVNVPLVGPTWAWAVTHTDAGHEVSVGAVLGMLEETMTEVRDRNRRLEMAAVGIDGTV